MIRLRYIEAMLILDRKLTRKSLEENFGIQGAQAGRDFNAYKNQGGQVVFDHSQRTWTGGHITVFDWTTPPSEWLKSLEIVLNG